MLASQSYGGVPLQSAQLRQLVQLLAGRRFQSQRDPDAAPSQPAGGAEALRFFREAWRHLSGRKLDRRLPWFPRQTDIQHRRLPLREIKRKGPVIISGHRRPRERDRLPRREQLVTGRAAAGEAVAWWSAQAQA